MACVVPALGRSGAKTPQMGGLSAGRNGRAAEIGEAVRRTAWRIRQESGSLEWWRMRTQEHSLEFVSIMNTCTAGVVFAGTGLAKAFSATLARAFASFDIYASMCCTCEALLRWIGLCFSCFAATFLKRCAVPIQLLLMLGLATSTSGYEFKVAGRLLYKQAPNVARDYTFALVATNNLYRLEMSGASFRGETTGSTIGTDGVDTYILRSMPRISSLSSLTDRLGQLELSADQMRFLRSSKLIPTENDISKDKREHLVNAGDQASVESGSFPFAANTREQILWFAFASGNYLDETTGSPPLPFDCFVRNNMAVDHFSNAVVRSSAEPRLPISLQMSSPNFSYAPPDSSFDVRDAMHKWDISNRARRFLKKPYDKGYLSGEFTVTVVTNLGDLQLPTSFEFRHFITKSGATNGADVRLFTSYSYEVTNVELHSGAASFLPEIRGAVSVTDWRFKEEMNGSEITYGVFDEKWKSSTDPHLKAVARGTPKGVPRIPFRHGRVIACVLVGTGLCAPLLLFLLCRFRAAQTDRRTIK
jgi:hypothetical protein